MKLDCYRLIAALLLSCLVTEAPAASDRPAAHYIVPSEADPAVKQFDDPSIGIASAGLPMDAPLAVFLPGTGGKPADALSLLRTIARQGYRVLGLEYDDVPAVAQECPRDPDPDCSAAFRDMRVNGRGSSRAVVLNTVAEAIIPRLVAALRLLDKAAPDEGWGRYLAGDQPRWERIVVSGLSQGAGMAAYMAKQHEVRRVVLFSSPWDFTGRERRPAPWLSRPSATPQGRWYAEYHRREDTAPLIAAAYAALAIPAGNIRIFDRDLPHDPRTRGRNPYHGSTIQDPGYAPQWRAMFGRGVP
jgi:hypothetical protein